MESLIDTNAVRMGRSILHIDINNFYASVEIRDDPSLRDLPVAVCGDREARHGIILAKNYKAKAYGVKTAETIFEAKRKCPDIVLVPSHFEKYEQITIETRKLLSTYSDRVEPFGMDEAWIDISPYAPTSVDTRAIADEIRRKYVSEFGLTASVGASFNKVFAKLGSDMKKPDATTVITPADFRAVVWPLPVDDLLFVGSSTKSTLNARGVKTIGDLANTDEALVRSWLGKNGVALRRAANGLDTSSVVPTGGEGAMKSIGNSFTPPSDINDLDEALALLQSISESVSYRMRKHGVLAGTVVLSVRDNSLITFERQAKLPCPSAIAIELRNAAFELLKANYQWHRPIRSLGIRATALTDAASPLQTSLFLDHEARNRRFSFENAVDEIRNAHGKTSILAGRVFAQKKVEGAIHLDGLYALR
ncbi:MAG: DNA polymerase IV [Clostridia bacterium]|nr:DNA polymerase IV [Clostridia bacterium]